jgi:hypothetical protein
VSFSLLLFQIALTRVLSVVVWYHFAFLTISMVMLGVGVPGVWFALVKKPLRLLPHCLFAGGVLIPAAMVTVIQCGGILADGSIILIIVAVLPAMLALGSVICLLLIKAEGSSIGRMYAVDLLGACLGAIAVIPLLHVVPTPLLAVSCALPCLLALFAESRGWRLASGATLVVLLLGVSSTDLLTITRAKDYDEGVIAPVHEKWSPTARLTVFDESFFYLVPDLPGFAWGRGEQFPKDHSIRQYWLEQDASAGSPITQFDGDLKTAEFLFFDVTTVGYQVRPPKVVAVIGAGGGRDILSALVAGAEDIDAVELNPHTIRLVTETFGEISGDIYNRPGVHAVASEGRSHLTHSEKRYDLIQISLIDSWAASVAGAFALAENGLYTVEAFQLYFQRLSSRGMISTSRWLQEMPRLLILARAALLAEGVAEPRRHMALARASGIGTLLLSRSPFSSEDIARLRDVADRRGFDVLYPVGTQRSLASEIIEGRTAALATVGLNLEPPTDDSPYFFQVMSPFDDPAEFEAALSGLKGLDFNFDSVKILRQTMVSVSVLALLCFMLPFLLRRASTATSSLGNLLRGSLFFAAIGTGFMLIENMLVQRSVLYLGHPSYALSVVIAALLLGMGLGSELAPRLGLGGLRRLGWLAPVLLLVLVLILPGVFGASLGFPLGVRVAITCAALLPVGAVLGLFFPLGMLRFGDADKPWFWAINGVFGVVAGVLSVALSMEWGFTAVGKISVVAYLLAWLFIFGPGRSSEQPP